MTQNRPTRSDLKRRAILDAAKQAFNEDGVQGTSMDALAALAGVSKRTVYNHFATKEALVTQIIADMWQRAMREVEVSYDAQAPLHDQLCKVVEAEIEIVGSQEYLDMARVALGYLFYNPELLQQEMARFAEQETAVSRWLKLALKDSRLKKLDVELATMQLHNLVKGSCFWPQLMQISAPLTAEERRNLASQSVDMFLSHYQVSPS